MNIEDLLAPERPAAGEWQSIPGSTAEFRVSPYSDAWRDALARRTAERTRMERREQRIKGGETLSEMMPSAADEIWRTTCLDMLLHDVRGLALGGKPATVQQVREIANSETGRRLWAMVSEAIESVTLARARDKEDAVGNSAPSSITPILKAAIS